MDEMTKETSLNRLANAGLPSDVHVRNAGERSDPAWVDSQEFTTVAAAIAEAESKTPTPVDWTSGRIERPALRPRCPDRRQSQSRRWNSESWQQISSGNAVLKC
jgi:hypothetical protein